MTHKQHPLALLTASLLARASPVVLHHSYRAQSDANTQEGEEAPGSASVNSGMG